MREGGEGRGEGGREGRGERGRGGGGRGVVGVVAGELVLAYQEK